MMRSNIFFSFFYGLLLLAFVAAQTASDSETATSAATETEEVPTETETATSAASDATTDAASGDDEATQTSGSDTGTATTTGGGSSSTSGSLGPPDVLLRVPELSVGRIELDVDDLRAELNLAAEVASLVSLNAGVQVGVQKVNITIADVDAELELMIRLGHLVDIVNRTLTSLDLNPLLINLLNEVTDVVETVVGAVDGLLGQIVQGGTTINYLIDNLGNIVEEVVSAGTDTLSRIVGNYNLNMTQIGDDVALSNGLTQRTFEYGPLSAIVQILFNGLDQVVEASVVKETSSPSSTSSSSATATSAASTPPTTAAPDTTSTATSSG